MTSKVRRIAEGLGFTIGKLSYDDSRRVVNHVSQPYSIFKDGRLVRQFATRAERLDWLEEREEIQNLPPIPEPKPMRLP